MKDWRQRFTALYEGEEAYWLSKGFERVESVRGEVGFRGTIAVRAKGECGLERHDFELRFDYPSGYPYVPPRVAFLEPKIRRARHQGTDGSPCLFPASAWSTAVPASELYAVTERWLGYHLADHFPRELALYELPEYFPSAGYAVLAPPHLFAAIEGRDSGRFSVRKLIGHDLGVLRSLDETQLGKELQDSIAPSRLWGSPHPAKWYRLDREPRAMTHSGELQALFAAAGHQLDLSTRPRVGQHLIGLVFEDRALEEERFFLLDLGVRSKQSQPKIGKGWPLRCPEVYLASRQELFRRLQGVRELDRLATKRVVCFGLGAIGSPLALSLAREGVGSFTLCDPDVLRPGNVIRHALDLTAVGQRKADGTEAAIWRIAAGAETQAESENLTHPDVLATHLGDADLLVAAIGDDLREELLTEVLLDQEKPIPMILARTLHAGAAYRVVLIRPGVDACFSCLAAYREEVHPEWIEVPADELPDVHDSGCATAAHPGAGLTSQQAASFAASRALELLEGRDLGANHWLWVERPIEAADPRLGTGLTLHTANFGPHPECPLCGD